MTWFLIKCELFIYTTPKMTFGHSREKRTATLTIFEVAESLRRVTNRRHIATPSI